MSWLSPEVAQRLWEWRREILDVSSRVPFMVLASNARREAHELRAAYNSPVLPSWLSSRYRLPLVRIGQADFPAAILAEAPGGPPDAALKGRPQWRDAALRSYLRAPYWLMRSRVGQRRRPTFVMESCTREPPGGFALTCSVTHSTYALRESVSLEWELLEAVRRCERRGGTVDDWTPIRNSIHDATSDALTDGRSRAAAVGITAVMAYPADGTTKVRLHRRGPRSMATRVGMYHAFPACIFQAPCQQLDIEYSISHAFLWEYYEEFFDQPDPAGPRPNPRDFYDKGPVRDLREMLANQQATHTLLGVALDLMNLRPEVITLVDIRDPGWFDRTTPLHRPSREFAGRSDAPGRSLSCTLDMHQPLNDQFHKEELAPDEIVPCTAAALFLAHKRLNAPRDSGSH